MNTIEFTTDELLNKGHNYVVHRILNSNIFPSSGKINSIIYVGIDVGSSIYLSSAFNYYTTTEKRNKKIYLIGNIINIIEVFIDLNLEKNIALIMSKQEYLKMERTEKLKKLEIETIR